MTPRLTHGEVGRLRARTCVLCVEGDDIASGRTGPHTFLIDAKKLVKQIIRLIAKIEQRSEFDIEHELHTGHTT